MYDAFSTDYDRFVDWRGRLAFEIPFLMEQLRGVGATRILDAACGTGMHAIALTQAGFDVVGADFSAGMIEAARANARAVNLEILFKQAGFGELEKSFARGQFDSVLCLGNSLPHVLSNEKMEATLADFAAILKPAGLLILQNRNFDAVVADRLRWMEPQAAREGQTEWLFLRFYDFDPDGLLTFNIITLRREGMGSWSQTTSSTKLRPLLAVETQTSLIKTGFQSIEFYGDMKGTAFNARSSGNLVVCARLMAK